ncbi:AfsR/SARP family transcriptional regulator [Umezawaea tangerina]|uniref:DNA-binding SARP family transcriptional activator n=1 Tax=Umezawaea tangerina TaxID=84725 RepID=A0A2T0SZ27_9PSEU|nr:tetratricopeptide repeat protein [Umezawaea tangerina]PRY38666.1 DNA-binding SARP family transcriptional activator [Umezawaea tangerina]
MPSTREAVVRLRMLGAVEAFVDGHRIDVGPARQQCVLAALLMDANRPVTVDQLVDRVWGQRAPQRAVGTLHSYLTRVRRALDGIATITRASGSYVLDVEEADVDLHRFRDLVTRARATDEPELYDQALGLWRGEAFAGLDTPWVAMVREQLGRERLAAELDRNDLALRLGRYADVLPALRTRTTEQPLDERLAAQFMVALYHAGRQADALEHFDRTRRLLAKELGSDPSPPLRRVHEAILRGRVDEAEPAAKVVRNDLPGDLADFTGREDELRQVLAAIPANPGAPTAVVIDAIDGMAGIGKTALAVHLAHLLTDRYPDAQLFVDLHGHDPDRPAVDPMTALETLLRALGVPGDRIPAGLAERSALWRAELATRRAVVVLDNAADSSQVRPLLPGTSRALTLITSRRRLVDLETARVLSLEPMPHRDAVALFRAVVGRDDRVDREPAVVEEVVRLCGHLPLALRIAAARLRSRPKWTVANLAQRLRQGLPELAVGDRSVAAAFALSYDHLTDLQRRLFRLLGLVPGADFDAFAAAALTGTRADEADRLLEELVDVHLLDQPSADRYRFHDLLREHARSVALETEPEADRVEALARLSDYYLHLATTAGAHLGPAALPPRIVHPPADAPEPANGGEALALLDVEHANLLAMVSLAAADGPREHTWQLTQALWRFYFIRGHLDDWITTHTSALRAARELADRFAEAEVLKGLGTAHWQARRTSEAMEHYQDALALYRELGQRKGEAAVLGNLGLLLDRMGRYVEAIDHHLEGLALYREIGDRRGEGTTLSNLGLVCERLGRYGEALRHCEQALVVMREFGDRWSEGETLIHLGIVHHRLRDREKALRCHHEALALMRELADRDREGQVLANIGQVLSESGRHAEALEHLRQALAITRETGDRAQETSVLNDFGEAHRAAGLPSQTDHQRALANALDIGDRHQQARAHVGLGHAVAPTDPEAARLHWELSLAVYQELGVPEAEEVAAHLAVWSESTEPA